MKPLLISSSLMVSVSSTRIYIMLFLKLDYKLALVLSFLVLTPLTGNLLMMVNTILEKLFSSVTLRVFSNPLLLGTVFVTWNITPLLLITLLATPMMPTSMPKLLSSLLSSSSNGVMSLLASQERCLSLPPLLIRSCSWVFSSKPCFVSSFSTLLVFKRSLVPVLLNSGSSVFLVFLSPWCYYCGKNSESSFLEVQSGSTNSVFGDSITKL